MKTMTKYILLLVFCISSMVLGAQTQTNAERRKMYMDVLNLINSYEKYAEVDEGNRNQFLRLFRDPSVSIYNDLMGISDMPSLTAQAYADSLAFHTILPEVVIRNVTHDNPHYADGKWYMNVAFSKELEYMDSCGIFEFSSKKRYGADHQINALVSWDKNGAKFESLVGSINTNATPYPVNYMIFEPRHPNDTTYLLFNGNPIVTEYYDGNAYAILPKAGTKAFKYTKDQDVHVKLQHDVNNKVYMTYKPKRWRLKLRYEQAVAAVVVESTPVYGYNSKTERTLKWGKANLLDVKAEMKYNNDTKYGEDTKSYQFEETSSIRALGLDLGYIFPSKGCMKWGFFTGAALRQTSINVVYGSKNPLKINRQTSTEDVDGDSYLRKYEFNHLQYNTKRNDLYIPAYFDVDVRCSNNFSFYLDFGAKAYWSFMNPITDFSANYTVTGLYQQYGGVEFDETFFGDYKLNGFVNDATIAESLPHELKMSNIYLDAFAGAGFRIRVYKDLYIDLGCNYQHNVCDIVNSFQEKGWIGNDMEYILKEDWNSLTKSKGVEKDPLYYDCSQDREIVTNVSDYYKSIERRNAIQFNVGLMFRF